MSWDDEDSTCSQGEISSIISFSPIYHKETALVLGNTQIFGIDQMSSKYKASVADTDVFTL